MYVSIGAELLVTGSHFINGIARSGGAIYSVGEVYITIESSEFTQNSALTSGGAIYLSDFRGVNITKNSVFRDNTVNLAFGTDIAAVNTPATLRITDADMSSPNA